MSPRESSFFAWMGLVVLAACGEGELSRHALGSVEDLCAGVTCGGNGACLASGGGAQCTCDTGYHAEGLDCVRDGSSPCDGQTCSGQGTCVVSGGSATCQCNSGYRASGLSCVPASGSSCDGVDCSGQGVCWINGDHAECDCYGGYIPLGLDCVPLGSSCPNQCSGQGACDEGVCACNTGYAGADCSACATGYVSQNSSCVVAGDPCSGQTCSGQGTCIVSDGTASCQCNEGYQASQLSCVPTTASSCDGVDCSGHGVCWMNGDQPDCECDSGYAPSGLSCVPVGSSCPNACSGRGACSGGVCTCNTGYAGPDCSSCATGYTLQGSSCVVAGDPCSGQTCSGQGTCVVSGGNATCQCNSGYRSSGLSCVPEGGSGGSGVEQRCGDLGAVCSCSEPLTGAVTNYGNRTFDMASGSTKPCQGIDGTFGSGNLANAVTSSSSSSLLSRLPASHNVGSVVSIQGITDGFMGGRTVLANGCGTVAIRWYNYKHTDYNCGSNSCKVAMLFRNDGSQWGRLNGGSNGGAYAMLPLAGSDRSIFKRFSEYPMGVWHRYELVFENCTGPSARVTLYEKNITDNQPERVLLRAPDSGWTVDGWTTPYAFGATELNFNDLPRFLMLNVNRQGSDGGLEAWSHFMIAQWSTTGQRIGSAAEVEGVGGVIDP